MEWLNITTETGQPVSRQATELKCAVNSDWTLPNSFEAWHRKNFKAYFERIDPDGTADFFQDFTTHSASAGHALQQGRTPAQARKQFNRILKAGAIDHVVDYIKLDPCGYMILASYAALEAEAVERRKRPAEVGMQFKPTPVNSGY